MSVRDNVLAATLAFALGGLGGCGAPAHQGYGASQPGQSSAAPAGDNSGGDEQAAEASSSSDSESSAQAAQEPAAPSCTPDGKVEPNGGPTCCSGHRACDNYNVCTCCEADGHTCL